MRIILRLYTHRFHPILFTLHTGSPLSDYDWYLLNRYLFLVTSLTQCGLSRFGHNRLLLNQNPLMPLNNVVSSEELTRTIRSDSNRSFYLLRQLSRYSRRIRDTKSMLYD